MKASYIVLVITVSAFFVSCQRSEKPQPKESELFSDSVLRTVQTATTQFKEAGDIIKLNGKIVANETKQAKVFALVSGKVENLKVELGDYVTKGQLLAVIKSIEVASTNNDLVAAQSDVELANKNMQTAKDLYESNLATEQEYINAKLSYNKSLAALEKAKQISTITGGNNSSYNVVAPLSGYVIEKNITNNSEVRPDNSNELFSIADLSDVWVMANVYEADIASIKIGDSVQVTTLANPDKDNPGKIDKIYNVLDPETRTMRVRITLNNPGNELKPEMFATVKVKVKSTSKLLSIPAKAIVMDNSKNYVVVKNNNKLEVHTINVIKRIEGTAFITGLSPDDQVLTDSQLFFYQALINK